MSDPSFDPAREVMLRKQLRRRGIHDRGVLDAMARVPRERFVADSARTLAYADRALAIACGQTISQPYIVALMTQALDLSREENVLEIGTGSGYQTAILAELSRQVVTLERHAELSRSAGALLRDLGYANVTCLCGDGSLGWPPAAPYDRIIVTAAAAVCPPPLLAQLADPGVLLIPLNCGDCQDLQAIRREGGKQTVTHLTQCRFVPLIEGVSRDEG
jgi:protein-L-isoaspartate(D-aspartate) O-methyltransferase